MKKLLLLSFFCLSFIAHAQSINLKFYDVRTLSDYQNILLQSINDNKMMFIVLYKNGDAFYQMQKDNLFANAELTAAYEQTNPMAVSITSEMGARLAQSIGVDSFPTFYYFNNEEVLFVVRKGYQSASDLMAALKKAKEANANYAQLSEKYSAGTLTAAEWRLLIETYALNNDFITTQSLVLEYFTSLPKQDLFKPENADLLAKYGIDLETPYPELIVKNKSNLAPAFDYKAFYNSAYDYNFDRAEVNSDTVLLQKIVKLLIPNRPKDEADTKKLAFETQKVFASDTRLFSVWKKAALTRATSMENDSIKAEFIFEEAFEIADNFNDKEAHLSARELAKQAYALRQDFRYVMLESYMAYLMKDYDVAMQLAKEAESKTDNANNIRKSQSLQRMISKEMEQEKEAQ